MGVPRVTACTLQYDLVDI
jgi:hypothetical protein